MAAGCSKHSGSNTVTPPPRPFNLSKVTVNGNTPGSPSFAVSLSPVIKAFFTSPIDQSSLNSGFYLKDNSGTAVTCTIAYEMGDSTIVIQPGAALKPLSKYSLAFTTSLKSQQGIYLGTESDFQFITSIDSTDKFPRISDSALLTLIQQQTFKYFWDFANSTSGLARERASSDVVTTGGSGFGVMAILTGIYRGFITRSQGLDRLTTMVGFLSDSTKVQRYHGAFSHWMNGTTGATVPFSTHDDGGDIVETSYLLQGLLCARQFFNSTTDAG